ncbi:MAG TPA: LysR substrate-binding domain-containing protein [Steroidobacteraceae bacterium]|nr:LysR substrate-binding domain-containing protein [Steroidobacteraceae bacterium]
MRRLPLGSLRVFVAVAHHLSFTRAADALGVTASAVSVQIRALEEYLARPLFRRNGREVHVTPEGRRLLPRVQAALEQLEHAIDDARCERGGDALKLSTLASYMQQWLLPRLGRFRALHGNVDLHLHTSGEMVDFIREDFHIAIRFGGGGWPNVHAEKLMDEWLVPVCAPAMYEKYGALRSADDLRRYPLLHSVTEPWTAWLFDGRPPEQSGQFRGSLFDDSHALVRMAADGAGLALARWSLVAEEVANGSLVRASPKALPFRNYWLVYPPRAEGQRNVKAFSDWIRAEAAAFAGPDASLSTT